MSVRITRMALAALLAFAGALSGTAMAEETVDLELVLLADASGSIDNAEIRFQREGYAAGITHPEVLAAIETGLHQRIAVTYVEWGSDASQQVVVPWTIIAGPADAARFAEGLRQMPRLAFGRNAIGSALQKGFDLFDGNDIRGLRRVIDLSADSANNWSGPPIETVRDRIVSSGVTINGLAILCRAQGCGGRPVTYDLEKAFADTIIGGPNSFVVTADSPDTFAAAVRRKLILEIAADGRWPTVSSVNREDLPR